MQLILSVNQAVRLSKSLKQEGKRIALVGGCFDILHIGHVIFLEKAKAKGDILMLLLESDEEVEKLKGKGRPINSQKYRAKLLASLRMVDVVVKLPKIKTPKFYSDLVTKIRPDVIAVTANDPIKKIKLKMAESVQGKLYIVTKAIPKKSTSLLVEKILAD